MPGLGEKGEVRLTLILLFLLMVGSISGGAGEEDRPKWNFLFSVGEGRRGEPLLKPGAIAVDTLHNEVYISDRGRRQVLVYNQDGRYLQALSLDRMPRIPYKLAVDGNGTLVIGGQDLPRIWSVNRNRMHVEALDLESISSEQFLPGGMAFDADGILLVVRRFGKYVMRVDISSGAAKAFYMFSGEGSEEVELQDVIQGMGGRKILISSKGYAVHIIDREGHPVDHYGRHGSSADRFSFPIAAAIGPGRRLWIVDTFQHTIKVFRQDGRFVREYGEMGTDPGKLFFPIDIAFGARGRLFVLEKGIARFQAFKVPVSETDKREQ